MARFGPYWGMEILRCWVGATKRRALSVAGLLMILPYFQYFIFLYIGCSLPNFILFHDFPEWNIQSAKKYVAVAHVAYSCYKISAGQMLEIKLPRRRPVSFSRLSVWHFHKKTWSMWCISCSRSLRFQLHKPSLDWLAYHHGTHWLLAVASIDNILDTVSDKMVTVHPSEQDASLDWVRGQARVCLCFGPTLLNFI